MTVAEGIELLQLKAAADWTVEDIQSFCEQLKQSRELYRRISASPELHAIATELVTVIGEDFDSLALCARKLERQRRQLRWKRILYSVLFSAALLLLTVTWMQPETSPAVIDQSGDTAQPHGTSEGIPGAADDTRDNLQSGVNTSTPRDTDTESSGHSQNESNQTTVFLPGPWNPPPSGRPAAFTDAWSRLRPHSAPPPSLAELQEWFAPVAGQTQRFFTGQHGPQQLGGFEGVVQLRAPLNRGDALRLSIPDPHDLRIYVYHGNEGLMIRHNDANDRAYQRMQHIENALTESRTTVETASRAYQLKVDAARPALKAIETTIRNADTSRFRLQQAEQKHPAAVTLCKQTEAALRKSVTAKSTAFREAPKATAKSRNADRRLRDAESAASRNPDDRKLKQAAESARQQAARAAELEKRANRTRSDASRTWSTANSRKLNADRKRRQVEQEIRRAQQQVKTAEQRIRQQKTRSKRFIDARDSAGRQMEEAKAAVTRLETDLRQAQQDAAFEAVHAQADPNGWALWSTRRISGELIPDRRTLRATDSGRTHSTELRHSSEIELCYQAGNLFLTRGDILLLSAPLHGPPDEVYFSGRILIDGIAMRRTAAQRIRSDFQTDLVVSKTPAGLDWTCAPSQAAHLVSLTGGGIELTSDGSTEQDSVASFTGRDSELLLLEVHAAPDTGIILQNDNGQQVGCLQYTDDPDTDNLAVFWKPAPDAEPRIKSGTQTPYLTRGLPRRHFLRLLFGCGTIKAWISEDSVSWAPIRPPLTVDSATVKNIGLFCASPGPPRRVALLDVQFHRFHHLGSIAGPASFPADIDLSGLDETNWRQRVLQLQPDNVQQADWLRACAVRSVTRGCVPDLAEQLFDLLLQDAAVHQPEARNQYAMLHEAALLSDLWAAESRLQRMVTRFAQVAGENAVRQNDPYPFSTLRRVLMTVPLWTPFPVSTAQPALVRHEILHSVYSSQWQVLDRTCRELGFFAMMQDDPLIQWAHGLAMVSLPDAMDESRAVLPDSWRHPLIHHVDKELYNQVAEFEAAVSTQAFDAALQIAASVNPSAVTGIVPSGADPQLYISLRTAVQSARNRLPDFKIRMDVDLLPAALIRVRQAIDTGDINGVTAVAMRFPETPAAAEAHAWLGDRALAAGNFQRALDHFRETHAADSSQAESQYTSKMILTAAMLGVNISNSRSTTASLNNRVLTASDFQQLVDEMRKRHPTGHDPCVQVNSSHSNAGRLTRLSQDPVIRFHENMTDVREFTKPADTGELLSDRLVRRLNLTVAGTQLFANTGCQIAAFNSPDGKRLWTSRSTDGGSLRPEPIAPLRQCITASWLFARQWTANGPALVCLSRRTGERQWIRPSTETEVLISDPILHRGNLYALIAAHSDKHQVSVRLMRFDPASGQSLTGRELVRLKQSWWQRRLCRVSARVDSFIAGLGEVVICADFSGQVRWMRSYTTVPADVDPTWLSQPFEPPLVDHRHVYLTQPGTRVVECLQRAGGELRWRTVVPSIRRLTGLTKSHVIAIIDQGLQAFTRDSGAVAWTHLCQQPVNWAHCSDDRYVVFSRRKSLPGPAGNAVPELIWLDVADGREVHRTTLDPLSAPQPSLSPLFQMDNRTWALFSRGQRDAQPELIELTHRIP